MIKFRKQFGGKVTKPLKANYSRSDNWKNGKFQNLQETKLSINFWEIPGLLQKQLSNKTNREPQSPLPIVPFDKDAFLSKDTDFCLVWYGHSAVLIRMNSKTIFIDPMMGPNASPISPYKTKRFSENTLDFIDDFPGIDLMLISHDHYDHLDYDSIIKLKEKTQSYFVALGVKRHLVKWGIDSTKITEFDWWNVSEFSNIKITFTPTRHFSGRGLTDRKKSLWGGWVFQTEKENIWFSGDGGYGSHFKEVGELLGPFDFAFMECGQYSDYWRPVHMFPEESVQAALDAKAQMAMPVHWAGFSLSQHSWKEPIEEFEKYAKIQNLKMISPELGQIVRPEKDMKHIEWWKEL